MVKMGLLNPEAPRQVAVRILMDSVQPVLSQALGAMFHGTGHPLNNLRRFIKRSSGQLAVAAATAGAAGGATSGIALWKASLRRPMWLAYELGLITLPLAAPIVGGVMGLLLGATGAAFLISRARGAESLAMAKLHAQVFSVLFSAEGGDNLPRQRIFEEIKDRLISTGLKPDVVESLFLRAPLRIEDLDIDIDHYELEPLRAVMTNAWQLARAEAEPTPAMEYTFARLCRRLNLGDEIARIKTYAQEALEKQSARIGAAIEAARHIGADFDSDTVNAALEQLITLDPLQHAQERRARALATATDVAAAAGTIVAVASGRGQILPIIGQAVAALHAVHSGDDAATKRLQARAIDLLKQLGISPDDATRFVHPIIETLELGRATAKDTSPEPLTTSETPRARHHIERTN
jgi:chorismate mutase